MATSPDLPSPLTPHRPEPADPADLPVEPDDGVAPPAQAVGTPMGRPRLSWRVKLPMHRQFMCAASYRWPHARTRAFFF